MKTNCKTCGKEFRFPPSAERKYCSVACDPHNNAKTHGLSQSRLHAIWCGMKQRCTNSRSRVFSYYGGRGITICDEWDGDFLAFATWAKAHGYHDSLQLDRTNVNGGYSPDNCRWANRVQQMRNTRKRRDAKTSAFKGVSWCANVGKWRVQLHSNGRSIHVGLFRSEEDAARAYDVAAEKMYGEFCHKNFNTKECVPS